MNRKEYWNEEYVKYWKSVTAEADDGEGVVSRIEKTTRGDYKVPGEKEAINLFRCLQYEKSDKLLDYGCGFGRFYPFFREISNYYGIDLSSAMIQESIRLYPENAEQFVVAEGEDLPFEDNFFDKIICYGVFDACYQEKALAEMLRCTCEGGIILVTGKNADYPEDDEQAFIAEEAARKKGHPNYFTDVKKLIPQLERYADIKQERFYRCRGDFVKEEFSSTMSDKFYEWVLIIQKKKHEEYKFEGFSDAYSNTWRIKNVCKS